jgi:NADH:ubiquinone reductase (non-electrogenic)
MWTSTESTSMRFSSNAHVPVTIRRNRASSLSWTCIAVGFVVILSTSSSSSSLFDLSSTGVSSFVFQPQPRHQHQSISRPTSTEWGLSGASSSECNENEHDKQRTTHRVCILGGGFAGVNAALSLAELSNDSEEKASTPKLEITVMDPKDRFVFLPLLYELCVGDATEDEVAPTYQSLFSGANSADKSGNKVQVQHKRGVVAGIDATQNCVYYKRPYANSPLQQLQYDSLIVCTGLEANPGIVPGASEFATCFYTLEDCYQLRDQLQSVVEATSSSASNTRDNKNVNVVVVGGGYSGVELALNAKEYLTDALRVRGTSNNAANDDTSTPTVTVSLIQRSDQILKNSAEFNRQSALDLLKQSDIRIRTNTKLTQVTAVSADDNDKDTNADSTAQKHTPCLVELEMTGVEVTNATDTDISTTETIAADILLWTAGAAPPANTGVLKSLLARDSKGRIQTTNTLKVVNFPNVYALGDCSTIVPSKSAPSTSTSGGGGAPATAQVAIQQAPIAAWNVWSDIMTNSDVNTQTSTASSKLPFRYLPLGEMMTLGRDEATISSLGGLVELKGPLASLARRAIYGVRMPTNPQRIKALRDSSTKRFESVKEQVVKKEQKVKSK